MPELPEVEHVVCALCRVVIGRRIVAAEVTLPKLILPTSTSAFNRKLKGSTITSVSRRGKFILIELNGTTPGTLYDQLSVTGAVNLAGTTLTVTLATLKLDDKTAKFQ